MNNLEKWKKDEKAQFEGWDFSYLKGRMIEEQLPWNYVSIARKLVKKSKSVLDIGTGGGEIFASLGPFNGRATVTEGYKPNVAIAKKNLEKLGVNVLDFASASVRNMPFADEEFDLILNRHDAFDPRELYRILHKGGVFLTQQVGKGNLGDLAKFFNATPKYSGWTLNYIEKQLKVSGFSIEDS